MPFFKTNKNIFVDNGEYFDPNWMDTPYLQLPEYKIWDYKREMTIEDVDIWECLWIAGGGHGVYASWNPYAEFYMIVIGDYYTGNKEVETYYGPGAWKKVYDRCKELKIPLKIKKVWVEEEEMWLYTNQNN